MLNVAFENPRKIAVQVDGNIYALPKREKKQKLREPLDYSTVTVTYDVPDRITGRQEVEELRRLCPKRKWNFLEINVPFEVSRAILTRSLFELNCDQESQEARSAVEAVMFPSRTVMDLVSSKHIFGIAYYLTLPQSLAIALYFAARGIGQVQDHPEAEPRRYTSPARVLLNGLGSDELLGGYGGHRTAFKAAGREAIIDEVRGQLYRPS